MDIQVGQLALQNAIKADIGHQYTDFGKKISPHKEWGDAAIKYAAEKSLFRVSTNREFRLQD